MQASELFKQSNTVLLDGGMGTMLQASGLKLGAKPEELNITNPELIESIHAKYAAAGSRIVNANTLAHRPTSWRAAPTVWKRPLRRASPTASVPVRPTVP